MVSKRWQRQQNVVLHGGLVVLVGTIRLGLELDIILWQKAAVLLASTWLLFVLWRRLHRRYAKAFVKVFPTEYDVAARVIQRTLNAQRVPFTKRTNGERVDFHLNGAGLNLAVEFFPLNLPVDDHLKTVIASKVTMSPVNAQNDSLSAVLRERLDATLAAVKPA